MNTEIGLWFDGATPPSDPSSELAFAVHCGGELLDPMYAALRAHTSQTTGLIKHLGPERYRRWWSTESFLDAAQRSNHRAAGVTRSSAAPFVGSGFGGGRTTAARTSWTTTT